MAETLDSIDGILSSIKFHAPSTYDPAGRPYLIGRLANGSTVKGLMRSPKEGQSYRFWGEWRDDGKGYGSAFAFVAHEAIIERSAGGVAAYLALHVEGVGPAKAERIVEAFGEETLEVLRKAPDRLKEVPGLRDAIIEAIREHFADQLRFDPAAYAALVELFDGYKVGKRTIERILKAFGSDALGVIRENPYALLALPRMGWATVDAIATGRLGYDPAGIDRHAAAVLEGLERLALEGHTLAPRPDVEREAAGLVGMALHESAVMYLKGEEEVIPGSDAYGPTLALAPLMDAERTVAERIATLSSLAEPIPFDLTTEDMGEDQKRAAELVREHGVAIIAGPPGTGKAQPLDATVYTPKGPVRMGELSVGDMVIGSDGRACPVVGVYPQGNKEVFSITFDDGVVVECCEEHLWSVWSHVDRQKGRPRRTLSLKQIMRDRDDHPESARSRHFFPMVAPIEFDEADHPIDPYLLGLLLGDGSFRTGTPTFSKPDRQLHGSIARLIPAGIRLVSQGNGKDFRLSSEPGPATNPLADSLRSMGLWGARSYEKFVPDSYKFSSVNDRIALLNGLLDTDGSPDRQSSVEFSTSSSRLANDVQFIVESLGGKARIRERIPVYSLHGEKKNGRINYRISICLPVGIRPFRLDRKATKNAPRKKRHPVRTITSIESVGIKPTQCIAIDSPDSLYVTDHCVLTHNTYTVARIVGQFMENGIKSIRCVSPTGKAAKRSEELLRAAGIGGVSASTIHRALGFGGGPSDDDEGIPGDEAKVGRGRSTSGFLHDEENPLDCRVLIVDETSMVDCRLAAALLRAVAPGSRVLFVGDQHQLPSVGPGSVLRDLIAGGVPTAYLEEIRRSDGGGSVVRACHAIIRGEIPEPAARVDLPTSNWIHVEESDPAEIARIIVGLHTKPSERFDRLWGRQVITPQKRRLPVACDNLNRLLADALNPGATVGADEDGPAPPFRIGDKVIRTKNGKVAEMREIEGVGGADVLRGPRFNRENDVDFWWMGKGYQLAEGYAVNGDMGQVVDIAEGAKGRHAIVKFREPERLVRLGMDKHHLIQAYAVTIHKAQGSGFPYTILPVHSCFYWNPRTNTGIASKELIYTAISRAEQLLVTVGQWAALVAMIGRVTVNRRMTTLAGRVAEEMKAEAVGVEAMR